MRHRIRKTPAARTLTVACLAAAGVLLAPAAASANVGNPGSFTFSVTGGTLQVGVLQFPFPTGSMNGQIDASGSISMPQSSLQFTDQPFSFSQDEHLVGNVSVTGTATVDTTSVSGTLDPATGAASLTTSLFASASFTASINGVPVYTGMCAIGGSDPANHVALTMTTDPPGVPYDDQTGAVTLAGALNDPVNCDPDLPVQLQFLINGGKNAGPSAASGTAAADQLPANVQFQSLSAPAGSSCTTPAVGSTGTVKCSLGSLAAGSSAGCRSSCWSLRLKASRSPKPSRSQQHLRPRPAGQPGNRLHRGPVAQPSVMMSCNGDQPAAGREPRAGPGDRYRLLDGGEPDEGYRSEQAGVSSSAFWPVRIGGSSTTSREPQRACQRRPATDPPNAYL
jgi:uncharacterized repeat protein (TIGR01451 family)